MQTASLPVISIAPHFRGGQVIQLSLDRSRPDRLCLERAGKPVGLEEAFREGFCVSAEDANVILTCALRHVVNRDVNAR